MMSIKVILSKPPIYRLLSRSKHNNSHGLLIGSKTSGPVLSPWDYSSFCPFLLNLESFLCRAMNDWLPSVRRYLMHESYETIWCLT